MEEYGAPALSELDAGGGYEFYALRLPPLLFLPARPA
jgi:hypothetical protein